MYCDQCGEKLPDDSKFCPNCGVKVDYSIINPSKSASNQKSSKTILALIVCLGFGVIIVASLMGSLISDDNSGELTDESPKSYNIHLPDISENTTSESSSVSQSSSGAGGGSSSGSSYSSTSSSSTSSHSYDTGSDSGGSYIGNSNTKKFHRSGCSFAGKIKSGNKVFFSSRGDAVSRGYSPCGHCNP